MRSKSVLVFTARSISHLGGGPWVGQWMPGGTLRAANGETESPKSTIYSHCRISEVVAVKSQNQVKRPADEFNKNPSNGIAFAKIKSSGCSACIWYGGDRRTG